MKPYSPVSGLYRSSGTGSVGIGGADEEASVEMRGGFAAK